MSLPLLQTKLYIPSPRPRLVARPSITAELRAGILQPLTLITAPAGFGKTTLVSEWIAQDDHQVAWLSLDDDDNDPMRFLTYVMAALQTQQPAIGATAQGLLTAPQTPPPKAILTLLLNDLSRLATPLTLVLDDYHLITTPAIHEALTFFIDHLPPSVHLVITSRIDPPLPLARWRVRNQLTELRAANLRFQQEEVATFLNEVMGLSLTATEMALLETRTEGWIAGLQLAALALQGTLSREGRKEVGSFIQAFSGSHRHVFAYLVEEVLNRQPEATLDFLIQTSLLERFSAALCDAMTGGHGSQARLEQLEQANLFLISLDDERRWYRYHHLFAEVLRSRLQQAQPQAIVQLHQRASDWYREQALWSEAIHHALAAQDFGQAARLIEQVGITFFAQINIQHALKRWLATLPATLIQERPRLCLIYAWILFAHLDMEAALQQVANAQAALSPSLAPLEEKAFSGEIAAMRALLMAYTPNRAASEALDWGRQALAMLDVEQATFRCIANLALGMAYLKQSAIKAAEQALIEATDLGRTAGNIYLFAVAASHQIAVQRVRGALPLALATCHAVLAWGDQHRALNYPNFGGLYINLADLLREQNQLDVALRYAEAGVAHSDQEINPSLFIISRLVLLRIKQAQGDWSQAWTLLREVSKLAEQHPTVIHRGLLPAITAQFQMAEPAAAPNEASALAAFTWAQTTAWEEGALLSAQRFFDFIYLYEHIRIVRAQIFIRWAYSTGNRSRLEETLAYLERQRSIADAGDVR